MYPSKKRYILDTKTIVWKQRKVLIIFAQYIYAKKTPEFYKNDYYDLLL